jgi:uncharacterized membrane protein YqiK
VTLAIAIPSFIGGLIGLALVAWLLGIRYIPHSKVGIVEKLWAGKGSLKEGRIVAVDGEAGFQADLLRGGVHAFYFPWQYRIHREPLVAIPEGKIGYVYSRDGEPLTPVQTLGRVVASNNYQDARRFLAGGGQRGRQRAILREGVYAINPTLFVVVAEDRVYHGPTRERAQVYADWQAQLREVGGFDPIVVGSGARVEAGQEAQKPQAVTADDRDNIGVVTVHDGPPIESGEVIAPEVHAAPGGADHDCFQDPEVLLALGGRRGKQLQVLTDGTYFVNRWFATVEFRPKTVIPIGYVGVVVSYYGNLGEDLTGDQFRYGEQVERGRRGVWRKPLPPGKYPLNPYALKVELVPTVNFVLRWITGMMEEHQYDKDLTSIALITADGYEPLLPLSLVLHIDYEMAPRVVQRFGDVKRLISQTLDPIISAYFRDVAQTTQMLDLLTRREDIQRRATEELGRRFRDYDITCVAVLIGRPESQLDAAHKGQDPIQSLYDQLRQRRLANEQIETYARQQDAAIKQRELNEARAAADKQTELTQTAVDVAIAANRGEAQLAEARRLAERDAARADGEGRARELLGHGEASRIAQTGLAEAGVFLKKIRAYGDPRLFALNLVAEQMARSQQPLVPERMLLMGADGGGAPLAGLSLFGKLLSMLLAEKAGLDLGADGAAGLKDLEDFVQRFASAQPAGPAAAGGAEPPAERASGAAPAASTADGTNPAADAAADGQAR